MSAGIIPRGQASAVLTIDLGALVDNWRFLRDRTHPAECAAVVKANAYGQGIEQVVPALARAGCRSFFVAHVSEGLRVRAVLPEAAGPCRVFVLNGPLQDAALIPCLAEHGLIPVIGSMLELRLWLESATPLPGALHVDTGMNRLGFAGIEGAREIADGIRAAGQEARIKLVMSHFVTAEERGHPLNDTQIARFAAIARLFPGVPKSLANSSGIFMDDCPPYDLVRPGYALYGGNPVPGQPNPMQPVVRLQARILQTRWIEPGETVGYGARWRARRRSHLATLGIGYGDGFPLAAGRKDGQSGGADAIVHGQRCPIVGSVSMDLIVIDVTDVSDGAITVATEAELLGTSIGIDELGASSGTFGYEILTSLGQRYHRAYLNE